MMYDKDKRIVITLDAGGTNFVFGAMQANQFIIEPYSTSSNAHDLELCLQTMVKGFEYVISLLPATPIAISFAFPGPADYPNGVIGGYLPNFPSFRDGVALGAFLEHHFRMPVFINNDGDLYAYGEAIGGVLPKINRRLKKLGSAKQYNNLIGYTFGTGFGVGFVSKNELHIGDNSCVETFCLPHKELSNIIVEEGVSVRAVKRVYAELSGDINHTLEPKDIYDIAEGLKIGDRDAAQQTFAKLGKIAGAAMASAVTLFDGLVVIGGGIVSAKKYIMPALLAELRSNISTLGGDVIGCIPMKVYNLDDENEFATFARGEQREISIIGTNKTVVYDSMKRIGVAVSEIGASTAISIGAYAFALNKINGFVSSIAT